VTTYIGSEGMAKLFLAVTVLYNYLVSGFIRLPSPSSWRGRSNLDAFHEKDHLDTDNKKRLEKMFYMRNRRYSPYKLSVNQRIHGWNVSDIANATAQVLNRELIDDLAKELEEAFKEAEELALSEEDIEEDLIDKAFQQAIDDAVDRSRNSDSPVVVRGSEGGYRDDSGVFRYLFPRNSESEDSSSGGGSKSENFEVLKNSRFSFKDFGGFEPIKEELMQIADLIVNNTKYQKYNVRIPRGILLTGQPGNGKTLLAKCFAGEINVPFIACSASNFVNTYVGVGAKRVRELFQLAKEQKKCIIFIDELDGIGRVRSDHASSSNSEKDHTLNELLVQMDGFDENPNIFVMAATNRVDMLDPALLRPGRMDKQIYIAPPDSNTRQKILEIHQRGKPMEESITMDTMIEMTAGFSAAQCENLLNEAMLRALREDREQIVMDDLEHIANRILSGHQSKESQFSEDTIDKIATHELGHALVGWFSKDHPKLIKVCLNLWSPKSPGFTLFDTKDEDSNIYTKQGLFSHLMVLLAGRIAEEVYYGHSVTTGARQDFEEAYNLAKNMIMLYGMGKQKIYPEMSDASKHVIDLEVNQLILHAQEEALEIITKHKDLLYECKELLKKSHVIKADELEGIIRGNLLQGSGGV
jgi:cell division protease FtsH